MTKKFGRQLRAVVTKMLEVLSLGLGLEEGKLDRELGGMEDFSCWKNVGTWLP